MEKLEKEEFIQVINYYKNKISEIELSYLLLQLEMNKKINEQKALFTEQSRVTSIQNRQDIDNFKNTIIKLQNEIKKIKNKKV
jgi:t-SNARE complex subunit (syntaxin)